LAQRIAIVGGGVSGLVAAHLLHRTHDVTVFEASEQAGGHVRTIHVNAPAGRRHAVDIGFIVYNEKTYPLFADLLRRIRVETQPSEMSFGVRSDASGVEYGSRSLAALLARPSNAIRPRFITMVRDILRFHREAGVAVRNGASQLTLGEYVRSSRYSDAFTEDFLVPMGSALWSAQRRRVLDMPASFVVGFLENHGMLAVNGQHEWRVVRGGSATYVDALIAPFADQIRLSTPVVRVERRHAHVVVDGETFDHVIFACHADQALRALTDPTKAEQEILGALPFEDNEIVLHTDTSVLPRSRRAWASWNYHVRGGDDAPATLTYNMNRLQTLDAGATYCVTLNPAKRIDPASVVHRTHFSHPTYTRAGLRARSRLGEISGIDRTHYCGAYWGYGFHEDGVRSGYTVAKRFGIGRA
jgi:predicted NAD/FAD-binding protein